MANAQVQTAIDRLFVNLAEAPAVNALQQRMEPGGVLSGSGVSPGACPFLAVLLRGMTPARPLVVVTSGLKAQEVFQQDVETWLALASRATARAPAQAATEQHSPAKALFYPDWEILPHETKLPHADVISERLETLLALACATPGSPVAAPLIVTNVVALMQRTFAVEELRRRIRRLRRGDALDPMELAEWLGQQGYEPEAQVNHKGEVAMRGGILDFFPPTSPWPIRLEFFGDDLDSLRLFDPISQTSKEPIAETIVPPAGEWGILRSLAATDGSTQRQAKPPSDVFGSLLDYLPANTLFLVYEPESVAQQAGDYLQPLAGESRFFIPWPAFRQRLLEVGMTCLELQENEPLRALNDAETALAPADPVALSADTSTSSQATAPAPALSFTGLDAYRPIVGQAPVAPIAEAQRREFFAQIHRWLRQGYAVHVFCNNAGERQRLGEIWNEFGFNSDAAPGPRPPSSSASAEPSLALGAGLWGHVGALSRGFLCEEAKLAVITDAEVFGRYKVQRPRRLKSPHAQSSRSLLDIDFTDLEEGDYVVHLQHGIGRYLGLQALPASGGTRPLEKARPAVEQECLVIEYAASDPTQPPPRLYVPVNEAHLVSKYVGAGKARPALNTLGGTRWSKAKEQAERAVRDLAGELLAIQAAREALPGHAFPTDTPWQREFEGAFLFEETPDQMRAIVHTKADLEQAKPMDRLICGDVGYGKTEVAIRAAFKAVMGGKQVAVLVPTTVLAQQHFNTFRERMADYPIRVEVLSRFRSRREQTRVIKDLAAGAVDVVIGTHRLLQADIAFKDLGLVVIDEEQRFGVLHKERFKQLRQLVDVLTLSATPIPRTLYLALTGARDMSTIETPPADRLPVETVITAYDERLIRDAIQRELNRGGQVYFLHNRVATIDAVADRLRQLVPHVRLVVGHGQMDADTLEEVMTAFVNGDADMLVSTTIIESGLDIPNANTIIIDRADRFGLSDLYQLRGRVGRYKHQAYAYFLIPRHAGLLSDARKRLSAIRQYSSLGSGFKIAMRDLEIRGAGNLLGPEQSGHITAVGFELYCQLLRQSVSALRGEKVSPRIEVDIRLDFLAFGPNQGAGNHPPQTTGRVRAGEVELSPEDGVADAPPARPVRPAKTPRAAASTTASAYLPTHYVADSRLRIEVYRKLAQVNGADALESWRTEVRDRFGPWPEPVELLLLATELKLLASARGVTVIESRDGKLMLTRHNDYLMTAGKFPRLTKKQPKARLNEIRRVLLALAAEPAAGK